MLFWLGVPLSYITDVDLTDDDLEGYEIFEEFTFHIEPSFLDDDRNLHVIDWYNCAWEVQVGIMELRRVCIWSSFKLQITQARRFISQAQ